MPNFWTAASQLPIAPTSGGGFGGLLGHVGHAKLKNRLVEFLGSDLATGHRITEIARVRAVLLHGVLQFA